VLAEALQPLAAKIQRAFVYGSIASGEARMDSDIDQALALCFEAIITDRKPYM